MAVDEMQHAVMRAAEAEIGEDGIGVAGEIAIGEEQQLDEVEQLASVGACLAASPPLPPAIGSAASAALRRAYIYVSHVDIFSRSVISAMLTYSGH